MVPDTSAIVYPGFRQIHRPEMVPWRRADFTEFQNSIRDPLPICATAQPHRTVCPYEQRMEL